MMNRLSSMETEINQNSFGNRSDMFSSSETPFGDLPTPCPSGSDFDGLQSSLSAERTDQNDKHTFEYFDDWEVGPRYKLSRILGHGSYGEVVEGFDSRLCKKVAIKRIQNIFDQPMDAKRVYREMHILRNINHPHIIRLLDVVAPHIDSIICPVDSSPKRRKEFDVESVQTNEITVPASEVVEQQDQTPEVEETRHSSVKQRLTPKKRIRHRRSHPGGVKALDDIYLVFEFVDTDLYKLILSPQYLTTQHIQTFLQQMLLGVKYLHSVNVIHRDLKPANILVNENCSLKICDFGLSRIVGPESMSMSDRAGEGDGERIVGLERGTWTAGTTAPKPLARCLTRHVVTRWYRSPELILLQDYTAAVDIWALGCVFAELLSMQQESVRDCEDRAPLFPGKSCPSLSGDGLRKLPDGQHLETNADRLDQLSVIFDVIGTPSEADIDAIPDTATRAYLRRMDPRSPKDFRSIYPGAGDSALRLLKAMLAFNPAQRITVDDALSHDFLSSLRWDGNGLIRTPTEVMSLSVESAGDDIELLKQKVLAEIMFYRESLPVPPPLHSKAPSPILGSAYPDERKP